MLLASVQSNYKSFLFYSVANYCTHRSVLYLKKGVGNDRVIVFADTFVTLKIDLYFFEQICFCLCLELKIQDGLNTKHFCTNSLRLIFSKIQLFLIEFCHLSDIIPSHIPSFLKQKKNH